MGWIFQSTPELLDPSDTLPGRETPILPQPPQHAVLGTPLTGPWREGQRSVLIGIGCYWGVEKMYWNMPGVESTSVGFAGGVTLNPTYMEVCTGRTNHVEVAQVVYDPERVCLEEIIVAALEAHDPTQGYRQGNDVGTQYRSAFYTDTEEEAQQVRALVERYGAKLADAGFGAITTEVSTLAQTPAGEYYLAEEDHQQYLHKVPGGYCPHHGTGISCG
ncbi:peptide-methionine (S)-S-oxide reductase MsrA [Corynebacterium lowii]|uniref:Peptide methionine sulfoxide reductase MsrA n=1 Tax=Corynebacterium lowii TaxID=1544413 RepID=A0A0Q1DTN8_9CORY|nr:peptide-methionine (S)-S-oxide reductase MsrA [Corynebacterium lowii]KQB83435.1 Peptide methionine sulfoxide reductase MsrA [Corynebacterium lowii]MDP9852478.1 peptide-methionine (S)-S-oxide reductase [Corynebacterium lowii]